LTTVRRRGKLTDKGGLFMRFTIRDLLWSTVVAAVCAAWWMDHRYQTAEPHPMAELWRWRTQAISEVIGEKLGWWVAWSEEDLTVYDKDGKEVRTIRAPYDERFPGIRP
jgi:hypothetical protein